MLEVGKKVKVVTDTGSFTGKIGRVNDLSDSGTTFSVEFSDGSFKDQAYWFFERELEVLESKPDSAHTEFIKAKDELLLRLEDTGEKVLREGLNRLSAWLDKIEPKR